MKYLLDTNVLRELGKTSPHKNVAAWLKSVNDIDLTISALTVREIAKGVAKLRKTKPETAAALAMTVAAIFDAFDGRILPIDRAVASVWGEALGESEKHVDDVGLAATARVHGLIVVTRNVKDFDGRGVRVFDPFTATR
jgi:predicted nucleic acid-binding protein